MGFEVKLGRCLMNERFKIHVEALEPKFRELMAMRPLKVEALPKKMPKSGIYLFSEGTVHLYVGRSKRLKSRIRYHGSDRYVVASFAFLLAREMTGLTKPSYAKSESRTDIQQRKDFQDAFRQCGERIRRMDIRFVEETDSVRQALLEIYAAIALGTRYNKFETT